MDLEGGCGPLNFPLGTPAASRESEELLAKNAEKLKLVVDPDVLRLRDSIATPDLCSIFNPEPEVDLISFVDI